MSLEPTCVDQDAHMPPPPAAQASDAVPDPAQMIRARAAAKLAEMQQKKEENPVPVQSRVPQASGTAPDAMDIMRARAAARIKAMQQSRDEHNPPIVKCGVGRDETTASTTASLLSREGSECSRSSQSYEVGLVGLGPSSGPLTGHSSSEKPWLRSRSPPAFSADGNRIGGTVNPSAPAATGPDSWAWNHSPRENFIVEAHLPARAAGGGWACPLTVHYDEGENPMTELPRLEGGLGTHVIVGHVTPGGKAHRAGVRAGHALVALNGRTEFIALPGWQVRLLLEAPITLGFDPAPTRPPGDPPSVELRLTTPAGRALGIPCGKDVCTSGHPDSDRAEDVWVVAEEVVFKPSAVHDDYLDRRGRNDSLSCWQPDLGPSSMTKITAFPTGTQPRPRKHRQVKTGEHSRHLKNNKTSTSSNSTTGYADTSWLLGPLLDHFIGDACAESPVDKSLVLAPPNSLPAAAAPALSDFWSTPWSFGRSKAFVGGTSPKHMRHSSPKPPDARGDTDDVDTKDLSGEIHEDPNRGYLRPPSSRNSFKTTIIDSSGNVGATISTGHVGPRHVEAIRQKSPRQSAPPSRLFGPLAVAPSG